MDMQVIDRLTTILSRIDHRAKTPSEPCGTGDFSRNPVEMAEELEVFLLRICDRGDVLAWNDKDVHRRYRLDVSKCVAKFVLVDSFRGNTSFDNLAEKASHS